MGPVVLGFDGSGAARHAVRVAGELLAGPAIVVHVYGSPAPIVSGMVGAPVAVPADPGTADELERQAREQAAAIVQEGIDIAKEAGFTPEPLLVAGDGVHGVWNALVAVGDERDARAIVVGHRELSWLANILGGSVAGGLVKHTSRPVLVVPAAPE